ncbi:MAG TPA: hypothetical protein VF219_05815, partial [Vicinamibacterales bacterium]
PPSARYPQRNVMERIAEVTGGQAFFPTSIKQLDEIYQKVLAEIRAQYTLGYVSSNSRTDGAWRKVGIRVVKKDDRGLRTRSRKGYFAPSRR